jgi:NodT family efflux transporter outer membrane factor (OMF) lipoprotein
VNGATFTFTFTTKIFIVAVALSAIPACAPHTPYTPPAVPPPADHFKENPDWKPADPQDTLDRGAWWTIFHDHELDTLESQVDVSNQTLKMAEAGFEQARAIVRQTRANLYPEVTATPGIAVIRPSGTRASVPPHDTFVDVLFPADISYEVDVWRRVRSAVNSSVASAQASAADVESARLGVHAELADDYFALRSLDRDKALLDDTVAAYERALQLTQNRYNGGLASAADVAQAETQLETTRAEAIDVESQRAAFEHAIAVLVGRQPSTFSIEPATSGSPSPPEVPGIVPSTLLERRPDIAGAERRVAASAAQIDVARAALYPLISLSAAAGFESGALGRILTAASGLWSIAPLATITVFDAGRRRAVVAERRAEYEESAAGYQQTVLSAFREVEDQLAALRVLADEAEVQARGVDAAQRSLTLATNRYRGGVATYLEVISAQSAELASERVQIGIETRRKTATVLLLKAIGGGWNASALPSTTAIQAR